jgi:outer membrane protein TolC
VPLLNSTVAWYEQALQATEGRFKGGIASEVEVQQANTRLETARAQAINVGVQRAQFEHAIATLVGKPASSFFAAAAFFAAADPIATPVRTPRARFVLTSVERESADQVAKLARRIKRTRLRLPARWGKW